MPFDPTKKIHGMRVSMMSAEQTLALSSGEIESSDTMNHRTLLPEPGGLFCQRVFGPLIDFRCACGKTRETPDEPRRCPRCRVERIESSARRTRFGHIRLTAPVCHIWRYKGAGNHISLLTGIGPKKLDKIVHYTADAVISIDEPLRKRATEQAESQGPQELANLLSKIEAPSAIHPQSARVIEMNAPGALRTGSGADAVRQILTGLDLEAALASTMKELPDTSGRDRTKAIRKIRLIQQILSNHTRVIDMILDIVLVLPPSLRPMMQMDSGQFASSDLNDLYRKVINRNNRLRRFVQMNTPDIILRNEKRLLQNAVDTLLDNSTAAQPALGPKDRPLKSLSDQLRGKKGRFRQNLLGKRVDYSGRSVIVSGPDLNLGQCGLPYDMAAELFRPHLIRKLLMATDAPNKQAAFKLSKKTHLPVVREALDELAGERVIILNRAPTLHRLSMQAFNPTLSDDKVIRLHPLSCGGFNADFDGDQMAVHAPLSRDALAEAINNMRGSLNTVSPADGSPSALPSLDIILGIYHMTMLDPNLTARAAPRFLSPQEASLAHNSGAIGLRTPIEVSGIDGPTSVGRILFNQALPDGTPYQNTDADKKLMGRIIMDMYESDDFGPADIAQTLDDLKNLGFRHAFLSGLSIGVSDMITPTGKPAAITEAEFHAARITESFLSGLIDESERHEHIVRIWQQTSDSVKSMVEEIFPQLGDLHLMATSGAKGNIENIRQMVGMRGLMSDPSGRTIERPVKSHFAEGLGVFEYFISTHGARKGLADTALRTSDAGYLTRRLVDAAHHIYISETDCQSEYGLQKEKDEPDFADSLSRRLLAAPVELSDGSVLEPGTRVSPSLAQRLSDDPKVSLVSVRTPLMCRTETGVCAACYGDSLTTLKPSPIGLTVGVIAAQSIGEPGTQLTMRTFHRGGVAGADITNGLPRVEEVLEARKPSLLATICRESGIVTSVNSDQIRIKSLSNSSEISYPKYWQNARFTRDEGDIVRTGDILSSGSADLAEILETAGPERTWKYATSEIQAVYQGQGVNLHNKHIEVILKSMFAFCEITDPGDTELIEGEVIRHSRLATLNRSAVQTDRRPAAARPLVCGITTSALMADGFLSAASFQRTTSILADASLTRSEDRMCGLKENVIAGQLIPTAPSPDPLQTS